MQKLVGAGCLAALTLIASPEVRAQSTIKTPGDHPTYTVEIEPHFVFGWTEFYASNGFGAGARFSIPIVENGFVPTINNSVAIGLGADLLHYGGNCYYYFGNAGYGCSANYLFFPVVMQWNFFVAPKWSVFGEPGLFIYHGFFDTGYCDARFIACAYPTATGLKPAFYAGARYYFSEHVALTMRIGYPTLSLGISFM